MFKHTPLLSRLSCSMCTQPSLAQKLWLWINYSVSSNTKSKSRVCSQEIKNKDVGVLSAKCVVKLWNTSLQHVVKTSQSRVKSLMSYCIQRHIWLTISLILRLLEDGKISQGSLLTYSSLDSHWQRQNKGQDESQTWASTPSRICCGLNNLLFGTVQISSLSF